MSGTSTILGRRPAPESSRPDRFAKARSTDSLDSLDPDYALVGTTLWSLSAPKDFRFRSHRFRGKDHRKRESRSAPRHAVPGSGSAFLWFILHGMTMEQEAVKRFGTVVAKRFEAGGGEPEDLLRGPFEELIGALASDLHFKNVVLAGEYRLAAERIRPDYGAHVNGALVGFIEIKSPGVGVETGRYRGRNKKQWERLSHLPNVLYTDGESFALYRSGELTGPIVRFTGDVRTAGKALGVKAGALSDLVAEFLSWVPVPPRRPKELAISTARLCRVLRAEVAESLAEGSVGLHDLAEDWRRLLYPDADDEAFANGYAQTVTFALLLARVEGIDLDKGDLRDIADELGSKHTLMARALSVLTDPDVLPKLAVSVETLRRVLSVVDWEAVSKNNPKAWLYFYEEFLDEYDRGLRKQTGSYYTPAGAVEPIVRLTEELLKTRLGHRAGYASDGVTVVDPAVGTGTFLFQIVDDIAHAIEKDEGAGAVGPRLRSAARRLIGFEIQASPYSVAELRLATEFQETRCQPWPGRSAALHDRHALGSIRRGISPGGDLPADCREPPEGQ